MRIVFLGTPEFAARILQALIDSGEEIAAAYTQPDKPVGRKQILTPSPVKELALSAGIPVVQPKHIKRPRWVELLREQAPDLMIVAAYGQILSQEILDIPRYGCINLHGSLLPEYRGAAPVQWAIANGEKVTGITAMQMDAGMDTGAMLFSRSLDIRPDDTADSLMMRLAELGAGMIPEILAGVGRFTPVPQQEELASYAPILKKEDGAVDWTRPAASIDCRLRGFSPWPGAYTYLGEQKIELLAARPAPEFDEAAEGLLPGQVLTEGLSGKHPRLLVATGAGALEVTRLQPQGKKAMEAEAYLRGSRLQNAVFTGETTKENTNTEEN